MLMALAECALALEFVPAQVRSEELAIQVWDDPVTALPQIEAALATVALSAREQRSLTYLHGLALAQLGRHDSLRALIARCRGDAAASRSDQDLALTLLLEAAIAEYPRPNWHAVYENGLKAQELLGGDADIELRLWAFDTLIRSSRALRRWAADGYYEQFKHATQGYDSGFWNARLHNELALRAFNRDASVALREASLAASYASSSRSSKEEVRAALIASTIYVQTGDLKAAKEANQRAVAIAFATDARSLRAYVLANASDFFLSVKDWSKAFSHARRCAEVSEASSYDSLVITCQFNAASALLASGNSSGGLKAMTETLNRAKGSVDEWDMAEMLTEAARYLAMAGLHSEALSAADSASGLVIRAARKSEQSLSKMRLEALDRSLRLAEAERDLARAELTNKALQQRMWWILAISLAALAAGSTYAHQRLRAASRALALTNEELKKVSERDPLTQLYNRRHFQGLAAQIARPNERRIAQAGVDTIALVDIDHFKQVNDTFGHAAGDAVLVETALRLRNCLRDTDSVFRWGGEEFLVCCTTDASNSLPALARRILSALSDVPVTYGKTPIPVTVSIGLVALPKPSGDAMSLEQVIELADNALYLAKNRGRHRAICIASLRGGEKGRETGSGASSYDYIEVVGQMRQEEGLSSAPIDEL